MADNKRYSWIPLYRAVARHACILIQAHNQHYPTQAEVRKRQREAPDYAPKQVYSLAYPRRVKESEEKTLLNVLKQWSKQCASTINSGSSEISNVVFTNRKSARDFKRSARGTNQHLAKGVYAGILIGEEEHEIAEYKCQFSSEKGRGVGVRPWKRLHGTGKDFEICIVPALLPQGVLPEGVVFKAFDPYRGSDRRYRAQVNKEQKILPSQEGIETSNHSISQHSISPQTSPCLKAVPRLSDWLPSAPPNLQPLSAACPSRSAEEGNSEELNPKRSGCDPQKSVTRLFLSGDKRAAYAKLLIESYQKNLAKAMDRKFPEAEWVRGETQALRMLSTCSSAHLDSFVDRCLRTIAHMRDWILLDPKRNFVMPPSKWFDLDYAFNIKGAYRKFYQPWQAKALGWQSLSSTPSRDANRKPEDPAAQLAHLLHKHLGHLHPNDRSLQQAKLEYWTQQVQGIHQKYKVGFKRIRAVILWLVKDKGSQARFWREDCAGFGLRSATGLHRHFPQLLWQMLQAQDSSGTHSHR